MNKNKTYCQELWSYFRQNLRFEPLLWPCTAEWILRISANGSWKCDRWSSCSDSFQKNAIMNLNFFPKDSYLGVLRLFLWVLEVARSRRLGIAGEVSVWQIPENSVNLARVNAAATFWSARFFFSRKILDGRFPYGKNDQWSICQ